MVCFESYKKMASVDSSNCDWEEVEDTSDHLMTKCQIYKLQDGKTVVHNISE